MVFIVVPAALSLRLRAAPATYSPRLPLILSPEKQSYFPPLREEIVHHHLGLNCIGVHILLHAIDGDH